MGPAHALELLLGALAPGSLGLQPAVDLNRTTLELGEPLVKLLLGTAYRRKLGGRRLLGFGQLPLNALQLPRQLPRSALARAEAPAEPLHLQTTLPFQIDAAVLGLDAQLLLGVLALLRAPKLLLARRSAVDDRLALLGRDGLRCAPLLLLGLAQTLLQARHVGLERAHGRLGGLGSADQSRVPGFDGAARAAFGQKIAFGSPTAPFGTQPAELRARSRSAARCLASLCRHYGGQATVPAGRPRGRL